MSTTNDETPATFISIDASEEFVSTKPRQWFETPALLAMVEAINAAEVRGDLVAAAAAQAVYESAMEVAAAAVPAADLCDYQTGEVIRRATANERTYSAAAAERDSKTALVLGLHQTSAAE